MGNTRGLTPKLSHSCAHEQAHRNPRRHQQSEAGSTLKRQPDTLRTPRRTELRQGSAYSGQKLSHTPRKHWREAEPRYIRPSRRKNSQRWAGFLPPKKHRRQRALRMFHAPHHQETQNKEGARCTAGDFAEPGSTPGIPYDPCAPRGVTSECQARSHP